MDYIEYTLEELKNLTYEDIKHLSKPQMFDLTKQIQKYARAQKATTIKKLKQYGIPEPVIYREFGEKKTSASQKRLTFKTYMNKVKSNQGRNYLISAFFDAQNFLNAKTSTIEGWRQSMKTFERTIKAHTGKKLNWGSIKTDEEKFATFFKLYNELKSKETDWKFLDSSQAFKDIADYMTKHKDMSYEQLYKNLATQADKYYDKQQEEEREVRKVRKIGDSLDLSNPL